MYRSTSPLHWEMCIRDRSDTYTTIHNSLFNILDSLFVPRADSDSTGIISVTVDENTGKEARNGGINVKTGSKQVRINGTQAGKTVTPSEGGEMVIPEGYKLVWNDEFNEGSELNSTAVSYTHLLHHRRKPFILK